MTLFNRKTIARHITQVATPSDAALEILHNWSSMITTGQVNSLKETALHGDFKSKIVEGVLGYKSAVGNPEYTVETEQTILSGSVDLALGHFTATDARIIAPFELKGAKTKDLDAIMHGRAKSPVQQAWEYATNNVGTKWVLVSNYLEIRLYGFGEGTQSYEHFDMARLHEPEEYARFMLLLSADNLLTGKTIDLLHESRKEDKDITDALYADYKALRSTLIHAINDASDISALDSISTAQTVLDRVLFIAFAEDTGLLPRNTLQKAFEHNDPYNPRPVWQTFQALFTAIDKGNAQLKIPRYNGGLFAPVAEIDALTLPDDTCEAFKKIGEYDFGSEISVTVLGHIFEQSIADMERLQAEARGEVVEDKKASGTSGRRKRDGVVYTPDYVARFIVEHTIGTHLREIFDGLLTDNTKKNADISDYEKLDWKNKASELTTWESYRDRLRSLRIVDPACGSGVFLIMAFDYLKAELSRVNNKISDLKDGAGDLFDPDSEILTHNLFGVDVNSESVEITKLSLWIKTARPGKVLDDLDGNIRVGDSLIEDSNFAYLDHAFTWKDAFKEIFNEGGFDIVLGNPPYVRMEFLKKLKPYLEKRFEVVSDRADLYAYFFERGLKVLKDGGRMGYISSSTFFKTGSGKPLRNFLRNQATLETVVDFRDHQIFEGVTTYPAILTMKRGAAPKDHQVSFWVIDEMPENNFRASFEDHRSKYPQNALSEGSWAFENPALYALRHKVTNGHKTIKEVYGSPCRGIVTGLNEAFVIDTQTKEQLCAEDPKSIEILKPFLEGKDLKRWRSEPRGLWIIYIPKNKLKIDGYPAIRDWLMPFKDKLEKRATKQEWFELQQAQEAYQEHFEGDKINYGEFSQSNLYGKNSGNYLNNKCYFIPSSDSHLLALLNSKPLWSIVCGKSVAVRGGFYQMHTQYVETLPIPDATDAQKAELAALAEAAQTAAEERYKLQENLRRRIPDLCPDDREPKLTTKLKEWWNLPDFKAFQAEIKKCFKSEIPLRDRTEWEDWMSKDRAEINRLSAQIRGYEDAINTIVYELFELTDNEIKLLKKNI